MYFFENEKKLKEKNNVTMQFEVKKLKTSIKI